METYNKDDTIIIERVGNGYQVRQMFLPGGIASIRNTMVFQDKGCVCAIKDGQAIDDTLFGWIDRHFT